MKRIVGSLLMLFAVAAQAAVLQPYNPTPKDLSFFVTSNTQVQLCVVGTAICGAAQLVTASDAKHMLNCGVDVKTYPANPPAGARYECREAANDGAGVPPVNEPTLVNGWVKLASYNATFQIHAPATVQLCDINILKCSTSVVRYDAGSTNYQCSPVNSIFLNFPSDGTPYWCLAHPETIAFAPVKLPIIDRSLSKRAEIGAVPASVSTRYDRYSIWMGSDNKLDMRYFRSIDWDLIKDFVSSLSMTSITDDAVNAFIAPRSIAAHTQSEVDFAVSTQAAFTAKLAPKWIVSSSSTNKRPYYKANAAGTGVGTALGDVFVTVNGIPTFCDGTKRLGTTNYYWVASVGGWVTCELSK